MKSVYESLLLLLPLCGYVGEAKEEEERVCVYFGFDSLDYTILLYQLRQSLPSLQSSSLSSLDLYSVSL